MDRCTTTDSPDQHLSNLSMYLWSLVALHDPFDFCQGAAQARVQWDGMPGMGELGVGAARGEAEGTPRR